MGKSADAHEVVISAAVMKNEKLGDAVLVFSGTSDNEPSVTLGVDQYLNFSGYVRCVCHTLAQGVNDAVCNGLFLSVLLNRINSISTKVNNHTNFEQLWYRFNARSSVLTS